MENRHKEVFNFFDFKTNKILSVFFLGALVPWW